jgi:hypothetical protein
MFVKELCAPAIIYLLFSLVQIIFDTVNGLYNTALVKMLTMLIFTSLLHILCDKGLGVISWIIVFLPFLITALFTTQLLIKFGLDPSTGSINIPSEETTAVSDETPTDQDLITSTQPYVINIDGLTHSHNHFHDDNLHYHSHTHPDPYNTKH